MVVVLHQFIISFTSFLASFSLFSLDLRLYPLGLIWLAALAKKALLTSHSGSCKTQKAKQLLDHSSSSLNKKQQNKKNLNIMQVFWIYDNSNSIRQCAITSFMLSTSSVELAFVFCLSPAGAITGVALCLLGAADLVSLFSSFVALCFSSSAMSASDSLSSSSDSAPPSSSSS